MAKDPAMLWYWADWHSGTGLLSRFLKGCYMDLLHAQFNNGRLSLEEIKVCLGSDFGTSWPTLQKKFKQDENNLFFNERLEQEQIKRKAFSQSRRDNVNTRYNKSTLVPTYVEDMKVHMENTNKDPVLNKEENEDFKFTANGFMAGKEHLGLPLTDVQIGAAQQYLSITKRKDVSVSFIQGLWHVFKIKEFTGKKYYKDTGEIYTHFVNGLKFEKLEDLKTPLETNGSSINERLKAAQAKLTS